MNLLQTPPRKRLPLIDPVEKVKESNRCWVPFGRVYDRWRKKKEMSMPRHSSGGSSPTTASSEPTDEATDIGSNTLQNETIDSSHPWLTVETASNLSLVSNDADVQRLDSWKRRLSKVAVRRQSKLSQPGLMRPESASFRLPDDTESTRFSVSSMRQDSSRRYSIQSNTMEIECSFKERESSQRVTLDDFIPAKGVVDSRYPSAIHIGQISADDTASVMSSSLAVSFDDGYSQLILKQSLDGETDDEESYDIGLNEEFFDDRRGAAYSHPVGDERSQETFDSLLKKDVSCTPWVDDKIDMVWNRIDGNRCGSPARSPMRFKGRQASWNSDPEVQQSFSRDSTRSPVRSSTRQAGWNADPDIGRSFSRDSARSPVRVNTRQAGWNSDPDIRQSFSHDSSIVSFSSVLGDRVQQPTSQGRVPLTRTLWASENSPPYPVSSKRNHGHHGVRTLPGSPIRRAKASVPGSPMRRTAGQGYSSPIRSLNRKTFGSPTSQAAIEARGSPMRCVAGVPQASPMRRRVLDRSRLTTIRRSVSGADYSFY